MKFDTIIIGGGLAGLTCGVKLSKQNKKCLIISSGQSALHFSSGSFDLLHTLNGKNIENPIEAIDELISLNAEHPYAKLGKNKFQKYADEAKNLLTESGVQVKGNNNKNHYRITPIGLLKPTWLSVDDFATSDTSEALPWKKIAIFNIAGFLDSHPKFVAEEFKKLNVESEIYDIDLPELESIRRNPSEYRATNIACLFDKDEALKSLAKSMEKGSANSEAVIFPACIGLRTDRLEKLSKMINKPIYLIPTFPPSIVGIRSQSLIKRYFEKLGGVYMLGDVVTNVDTSDVNNFKVFTRNHGNISFDSENLVIATGGFFSKGLVASREKVFEPILNLDLDSEKDRKDWYAKSFFDDQNYQRFGVKTDNKFRVMKDGKTIPNFYAAGAILSNFNALKEGCGSGVSLLTALSVADSILKED